MIMPRGAGQLLLPVNPAFIALSVFLALLADMVPIGRFPAMPDFLSVVLVFWGVHQPRRVGVVWAFVLGLMIDIHHGALLGQHALAYSLLSFGAITLHRRLTGFSWAPRPCRCCLCLCWPMRCPCWCAWPWGACGRVGRFCSPLCSRLCCGRWPACCCLRRSAVHPTVMRTDRCDLVRTNSGVTSP